MDAIALGPLLVSLERLLAVLAIWLFLAAATLCSKRISRTAWEAVLVALLLSRVVFVLGNWDLYAREPATILYLWQGGFSLPAGLATAALYMVARLRSFRVAGTAIALLLGVSGAWLVATTALQPNPIHAPALAIRSLEGEPIRLADLRGRPVVINLWATWCPPCRREMPVLMDAAATSGEVTFLMINQGESPAIVEAFLKQEGLATSDVYLDAQGAGMSALQAQGLPATYFVSADGLIVERHIGELSRPSLRNYLRRLE